MQAIYDLETYPNFFLCGIRPLGQASIFFEISPRRNDREALRAYLKQITLMIGYNNLSFDYPVLHHVLMLNGYWMDKVNQIFNTENRFEHELRPWEQIVPQMDLFRIHHFDNKAKRTSLKTLEFNMRSESIEDLPIEPGTILTSQQMDIIIRYNDHDLSETEKFYFKSIDKIEMRASIGPHAMNYNDTKIGKRFLIDRLEKACPGICFYSNGKPQQTLRPNGIRLADIIFPYIRFETVEFADLLAMFKTWTIHGTKGGFLYTTEASGWQEFFIKEVTRHIGNFIFNFGTGGIHGSVKNKHVQAGPNETILDIDVVSYYPSIPIANRFAPEHLGDLFCTIYAELKTERLKHKKGSSENTQLKYALNGVYGDSNSQHSPFCDPQYTMKTTINGQLLLCMLAEQVTKHAELIQINTDGMTIKFDKSKRSLIDAICKWWQAGTCLDLEFVEYSNMWIRDVNNYIAQKLDGKLKRKGAYEYENLEWHKNHGSLIIQRAAEAAMVHGADPVQFMMRHPDKFDFFELIKAPGKGKIITDTGRTLTKNSRIYVSTIGEQLTAIHPPLAGKTEERRRAVLKGRRVTVCNRVTESTTLDNLDLDYYFQEARKLIIR